MFNKTNEKKKLAYVDFWTHKDTKSGDFLRDIFSNEFEIVDFWWKPREKFPIDELKKYDHIFFFHIIFPFQFMKKLIGKNITWAPMYDGLDKYGAVNFTNPLLRKIFWKQMSSIDVKILKFSKKISESIGSININSLELRYYIKPSFSEPRSTNKRLNIFFWDRGGIKFKDWIKHFKEKDINELTYFSKPDYGRSQSYSNELSNNNNFKINFIKDNFLSKEKFIELMTQNDVFIAPRKKEGIGMTIVEAFSRGMFIVGYNDSTMNEYINDNKLGFLFDEKSDQKIDINYILNNFEYRRRKAEQKYNDWTAEKKNILPFVLKKPNIYKKTKINLLFLISDLNFLLKRILRINYFY